MKKKSTILLLACATTVVLMTSSVLKDDGISGYAMGQPNCTGCHSGTLNSGGGSIAVTSSPAFVGGAYIPGTVYTMSVTISRTGSAIFGLDVEALNSSNANSGTLAITNATETKILTSGTKKDITHQKNGGVATNTKTFQFKWTAPAKGGGTVTFYATGLAGNKNGSDSGDYAYTTKLAVTEGTSTGIDHTGTAATFSVYPNPAAEKIDLNYSLTSNSMVTCSIYSLTGTLVAMLLNEQQNAGIKSISFTIPARISKGIYVIKLNTGDHTIAKKLIINN